MTLIKPLIRAGKAAAKETRKNKPFFSAVDKAALELPRPKGTGKEFMTELRKVPGVKPAEIQHRKLERIEALPKMEKADFLKQLEENPPVDLDEMQFLEDTPQNRDLLADERFGTSFDELRPSEAEDVEELMATYSQYRVPGGENYREIVLQMPSFGGQDLETLNYLEAMERRGGIGTKYGEENLARLRKKRDEMGNVYRTPHWDGVPNVLAHMRVQDRTGPSGEKILHVEEIQSDWHQKGRKHGYGSLTPEERDEMRYLSKLTRDSADETRLNELKEKANQVPDAPFKKNWHELAMKRLINYAAENGYDSIAITPGVEQANRYKMSSHIDNMTIGDEHAGLRQISWIPKGGRAEQALKFDKNGNVKQSMIAELEGKNISEVFGKDLTEKIVQSKPYEKIEGVDLDVGGEGMRGFYDKMLPDYLNSFGKKYGSQVEIGGYKLQGDPSLRGEASERLGLAGQRFDEMTPEEIEAFNAKLDESNAQQLHHFKITPEMREEVTSQGMPLYQKIGVPLGTGAAGAEMEVPQPTEEVEQTEEPAFAMGGAVYNTNPDMRDGGQIIQGNAFKRGGKVHVTNNVDAMFMDVHDKMFKRK